MPNIRTYTSPVEGFRPSDLGSDAAVQAARRIGSYANESAAHVDQEGRDFGQAAAGLGRAAAVAYDVHQQAEAQHEIAFGAAKLSDFTANQTAGWNDLAKKSDPNDTSIRTGFFEKSFNPGLDKLGDAFQTDRGKEWFAERAAALKEHFQTKTAADQASRAGDALVQNINTFKNNTSNTVYSDPSSYPFARDNAEKSIGAMVDNSPSLTPEQAAKAKTEVTQSVQKELAHSAFKGMADVNPTGAVQELNKGTFDKDITGDERGTLQKYAESIQHMQLADKRSAEEEKRRQEQQVSEKTFSNYFSHVSIDDKGGIQLPAGFGQAALTDQRLKGPEKAALIGLVERANSPKPVQTDWDLVRSMTVRAAGDNPPDNAEVYSHIGNGLSTEAAGFVLRSIADGPAARRQAMLVEDTIKRVELDLPIKAPMTGAALPGNALQRSRFMSWFVPEVNRLEKAGPQALQDGLNPDSKSYILGPEKMKTFAPSGDEMINYANEVAKMNGQPPTPPAPKGNAIPSLDKIFGGQAVVMPMPQ